MKVKKPTSQVNGNVSNWRFRREITLGNLLHLLVILIMLVAGWSNLQKELALVRHDLDQLLRSGVRLQEHLDKLAEKTQEHEYRLRQLEKCKV